MQRQGVSLLLLTCGLAIAACGGKSQLTQPSVCPAIPPLPASLVKPLNAEQRLSETLLESEPSATQPRRP